MKVVTVVISGAPEGDNLRELEVDRGTTAGDCLRALNLSGYLLSRDGSGQHFAEPEDIYHAIEDGMKLRATPRAEVGGGILHSILRGLFGVVPPVVVRPEGTIPRVRQTVPALAARSGAVRVSRDQRPLWEIRGWRKEGDRFIGAYRTPLGSYAGTINLKNRARPEFYIEDVPEAVLKGGHGSCFRARPDGTHFVHFGRIQPEVDAGIVAIERIILTALKGQRRSA